MLTLHIKAPFAVFRTFNTGSFRPTADFITPSAAYGLLLNFAGIESRLDDGSSPMTLMRDDLPSMKLAVGAFPECAIDGDQRPMLPQKATVFQQLHNYPVGTSGKEHAPYTKGSKYNITPVRREVLVGFEAALCIEAGELLEDRILRGLRGELTQPRYGLPFLGDNAFLPDKVMPLSQPTSIFWFCRVSDAADSENVNHVVRLTEWIDRADSSRTTSHLFAPAQTPSSMPPRTSWTICPPA